MTWPEYLLLKKIFQIPLRIKWQAFKQDFAKQNKESESEVSYPISKLINKSFEFSVFPNKLKIPLHKKSNTLIDKGNYSEYITHDFPKKIERSIETQLDEFFNSHFHNLLSAFRKGYGCQTTLLKIIEDWKKALDQNKFVD
jgi:hypothetical protein